MPDFKKNSFKPAPAQKDLTIPLEFELASIRRHELARQQLEAKLQREVQLDQEQRCFRAQEVPDYEALEMCIMPSDKPSTVAVKPKFASDALPTKKVAAPQMIESNSPKDFVF